MGLTLPFSPRSNGFFDTEVGYLYCILIALYLCTRLQRGCEQCSGGAPCMCLGSSQRPSDGVCVPPSRSVEWPPRIDGTLVLICPWIMGKEGKVTVCGV